MTTKSTGIEKPVGNVPVERPNFPPLPPIKPFVPPNLYQFLVNNTNYVFSPVAAAVWRGSDKFTATIFNSPAGGTLVTFSPAALQYVTVAIPSINMDDTLAQPFQTVAILTRDLLFLVFAPPVGQLQSIECTSVQGMAYR